MKGQSIAAVGSLGLFVAGVAAVTPSAKGALVMTLSEPGKTPVSVTAATGSNTVVYTTAYGDFATDIVVGLTNSGTPTSVAQLQVQALDVRSTTGSQVPLTITLSDTFAFPGTVGSGLVLSSGLGGTMTGSASGDFVQFQSSATPLTGTATSTALQTYTSAGSATGLPFRLATTSSSFIQSGSYTLSDTLTFGLTGVGSVANLSGTTTVSVPEPATASLAGLVGAGLLARRRRAR